MSNQRYQYYTAWCITDGSVIGAGLGYNGQDKITGTHSFDRITSINIIELETGNSPNTMFQVK